MSAFIASLTTILIALFPITNPPGTAFLFYAATRYGTHDERRILAGRIAIYAFLIVTGSLYIGAFVLQIFGISIPALRIAGGIVVTLTGWQLLNAPPDRGAVSGVIGKRDLLGMAFYPLTLPLTTGPGTIAVTIALGAGRSRDPGELLPFALGATAATAIISAMVYVCYRYADRMEGALGQNASDAIARLFAFILMCLGIEILWSGISALIVGLRHA